MITRTGYVLAALIVVCLLTGTAYAEIPKLLNYQALVMSGDQPVTTPVSIVFAIYDDSTGGALLWSEIQVVEPDADGTVAVLLGTVNGIPDTAFTLSSYLGVTIESDPEMQPRQRLVSVPNAFVAQSIDGDFRSAPGSILLEGGHGVPVIPKSSRNGLRKTLITGDSVQTVDDQGNTNCRQASQDLLSNSLGEVHRATAAGQELQNSLGALNQNTAEEQVMQNAPGYANTQQADQNVMEHPDGSRLVSKPKSQLFEGPSGETNYHKADEQVMEQQDGSYLKQTAQQQQIQTAAGFSNVASALGQQFQTPTGVISAHSAQSSSFTDETGKHFEQTAEYAKAYDDVDTAYLDKRQVSFHNGSGPKATYGYEGMLIQNAAGDPVMQVDQTGAIEASGLQLPDGAVAGHVLTSDVNGTATWQAAPTGVWVDSGSVLYTREYRGIARGGNSGNKLEDSVYTMVNLGVACTTACKYSVVSGGLGNRADGNYTTVAGGYHNRILNNFNTIGGGEGNAATGFFNAVGGGQGNRASGWYSSIPGGDSNMAYGHYSWAGGRHATAQHSGSFVWADGTGSGLSSTGSNQFLILADGGVGIGTNNPSEQLDVAGTVRMTGFEMPTGPADGYVLTSDGAGIGTWEALPLGEWSDDGSLVYTNTFRGLTRGAVAGDVLYGDSAHTMVNFGVACTTGVSTVSNVSYVTISGGLRNEARGSYSTVAGGRLNRALNNFNTVGGGGENEANGFYAVVSGGHMNETANWYSCVPGGQNNEAFGNYSLAGGRRAHAYHAGAFVWSDSVNIDFNSTTSNEFSARATGGVRFVTAVDGLGAPTAGVQLAAGGSSWSVVSDRNAKDNIAEVDPRDVLQRLAALPISTWNYKTQDQAIRHMGPMAQDLHAAFGLGEDNTRINTIDADGIALAAIQGLHQQNLELRKEIADLQTMVAKLLADQP